MGKYLRTLARFPEMCLMKNRAVQCCNILTSPEGVDSLSGQNTLGAIQHARVGLVQTALLDHLILNTNISQLKPPNTACQPSYLILDQKLDSLNGGGGGLGDSSSHAGEHEVLGKSQFLVSHVE